MGNLTKISDTNTFEYTPSIGCNILEAIEDFAFIITKMRRVERKSDFSVTMKFNDTVFTDTEVIECLYNLACEKMSDETYKERELNKKICLLQNKVSELQHKLNTPELIKKYIEQGHKILDKEYWKLWYECVPIRVSDLYEGFECECTLELVKMLNNQASLEDVHKKFFEQNHSGMSYSLVQAMVTQFCKRGKEFNQYENA